MVNELMPSTCAPKLVSVVAKLSSCACTLHLLHLLHGESIDGVNVGYKASEVNPAENPPQHGHLPT